MEKLNDNNESINTEWDSVGNPEQTVEEERKIQQSRGRIILAGVNFQVAYKDEVEPVFDKARSEGTKLEGKNPAERRVDAFLKDIEADDGSKQEKLYNFMDRSIQKNISDAPEHIKQNLLDQLEDWRDYLSEDKCELPTWFKMWAWSGMTQLGGYNTKNKTFDKRSKGTIHTYPPLDKEALESTYDIVSKYLGQADGKTEDFETDGVDMKDLQRHNFNAIYSRFFTKNTVPTPEYGEEIRGAWTEYKLGDEDKVARAANGTGWCIVSPTKAKEYLEKNDASFVFLHLENPLKDGEPDYHACASIRMEDGEVAEISGRRPGSGQMLEDALVVTVGKKVLSMPGGEKYRQAFEDRVRLIELCRQEDELGKEDLEFVYELDHKIPKLEKHCSLEPHLAQLKSRYGIETAVAMGVDKDDLIQSVLSGNIDVSVNEENTLKNLEGLARLGAPVKDILSAMSPLSVMENFDRLISVNVSLDEIMDRVGSDFLGANIGEFMAAGVNMEQIMSRLSKRDTARNLESLLQNGADAKTVAENLWPEDILANIEMLNEHGAGLDYREIVESMSPMGKIRSFDAIHDLDPKYDIYGEAVAKMSFENDRDTILYGGGFMTDILKFLKTDGVDVERFWNSIDDEIKPYIEHRVTNVRNTKSTSF